MQLALWLSLAYMVFMTVLCIVKGFTIAELEGRVKQQTERADRHAKNQDFVTDDLRFQLSKLSRIEEIIQEQP